MAFGGTQRRTGYAEIGGNPFEEDHRDEDGNPRGCAAFLIFESKTTFAFVIVAWFLLAVAMCLGLSMVCYSSNENIEPSAIVTGLSCIKCGDDGKCRNNATETLTVCPNEEMTCMLKSESDDDGHTYDVKDCYTALEHLKMVGCLKISSDMPGGENEHICLCAKDGCNEKMCPKERCDCAFADPDNCIHIDPSATPISCRHCEGEDCRDGKNGEYKPCTRGESSCMYVNAQVANNNIISRACYYEETGARVRGCVEVEEGDSFKGEICYCDTDDCNQQTCDNRFCDCPYSDPNNCIKHYEPNGTSELSSVPAKSMP